MSEKEVNPDSSQQAEPAPDSDTPAAAKERKTLRRKTIQFVTVFVVSVLALLTAHSMLVHTRCNDFYLYQVARSTAWLLDLVGESGRVVGNPRSYPGKEAYVRATMEAWAKGGDEPDPVQFQHVDAPPLTPWESWRYWAMSRRRELQQLLQTWEERGRDWLTDPVNQAEVKDLRGRIQRLQGRDLGPTVTFILKSGPASKIAELRREMLALKQKQDLTEEEQETRTAEIQNRLQELEQKREKLAKTNPKAINDMAFTFVVVPDCGAIPTMVIFIAAVLAFPARWWKKLVGIGAGLPVLYGVNTLRLTVLAVIGAWDHGGAIFKFAHEYVWQGIYIIFVVVTWLAWVELLVRRGKSKEPASE